VIERKNLKRLKEVSLMLAMFFLPLGYDGLFKLIMNTTGSYWIADVIFYCISGIFWICYILLLKYLKNSK
jgi:hypothetical protein